MTHVENPLVVDISEIPKGLSSRITCLLDKEEKNYKVSGIIRYQNISIYEDKYFMHIASEWSVE